MIWYLLPAGRNKNLSNEIATKNKCGKVIIPYNVLSLDTMEPPTENE